MSRSIRAHQYDFSVDPSSTLKKNSHFGRRLTDKPDIFLESLDNSEQNQHKCIFNFFLKIFWVGPLKAFLKLWKVKFHIPTAYGLIIRKFKKFSLLLSQSTYLSKF